VVRPLRAIDNKGCSGSRAEPHAQRADHGRVRRSLCGVRCCEAKARGGRRRGRPDGRGGEGPSVTRSASAGESPGAAKQMRLDVARSNGAGEQAVVPDSVEAAWQYVREKAADELRGVERHGHERVAAFDPAMPTV